MPNINDILLKRKLAKRQKKQNEVSKVKRSFHDQQKYVEKAHQDKLASDILGAKKNDFYNSLFANDPKPIEEEDGTSTAAQPKKEKYKRQKFDRDHYKQQLDEKRIEKEQRIESEKQEKLEKRKQIKKIFTERTKTGQPVMKNYINYLVNKLETQKKNADATTSAPAATAAPAEQTQSAENTRFNPKYNNNNYNQNNNNNNNRNNYNNNKGKRSFSK